MPKDYTDPDVTIRFELLKRDVTVQKEYSIASDYTTATDGWDVKLFDTDTSKLRGLELHPVEILVNGQQQVLGRVDKTTVGDDGTAVTVVGRDYLADLTECNIDPAIKLSDQMTIADALTLVFGPCGIDTILDYSESQILSTRTGRLVKSKGKSKKTKKLKDYKPEPGMGMFQFAQKIAARHGTTIQPADNRKTVLLSSPDYKQQPIARLRRTADSVQGVTNNLIRAVADRDFSKFPTVALFSGAGGAAGQAKARLSSSYDFVTLASAFEPELKAILARVFPETGAGARRKPPVANPDLPGSVLYRLLNFRDNDAKTQEQLEFAARRAIADRLKDTLVYRVRVRGHSDPESGAIWSVNTMVEVQDDICGLKENLWIASRTFSNAGGQGAVTDLELWRPNVWQIDPD